jgi:hypothetical protein
MSNCTLTRTIHEGYKQCLTCYINEIMTPFHNITLNKSCSPIPDNHCVDLFFNTTIIFQNFSIRYDINSFTNKYLLWFKRIISI